MAIAQPLRVLMNFVVRRDEHKTLFIGPLDAKVYFLLPFHSSCQKKEKQNMKRVKWFRSTEKINRCEMRDRPRPCYVSRPGRFLFKFFRVHKFVVLLSAIFKNERLRFMRFFCTKTSTLPPDLVRWCRLCPSHRLFTTFRRIFISRRPVWNWLLFLFSIPRPL